MENFYDPATLKDKLKQKYPNLDKPRFNPHMSRTLESPVQPKVSMQTEATKKFNRKQFNEYLEQMYYIETEQKMLNFKKKDIRKLPMSKFGVSNKTMGFHMQKQYMQEVYGSPMSESPQVQDFLNLFENTISKNKKHILDRMFLRKQNMSQTPKYQVKRSKKKNHISPFHELEKSSINSEIEEAAREQESAQSPCNGSQLKFLQQPRLINRKGPTSGPTSSKNFLDFPWTQNGDDFPTFAQKSFSPSKKRETPHIQLRSISPHFLKKQQMIANTLGSNSQATELLHNKDAEQYYKDQQEYMQKVGDSQVPSPINKPAAVKIQLDDESPELKQNTVKLPMENDSPQQPKSKLDLNSYSPELKQGKSKIPLENESVITQGRHALSNEDADITPSIKITGGMMNRTHINASQTTVISLNRRRKNPSIQIKSKKKVFETQELKKRPVTRDGGGSSHPLRIVSASNPKQPFQVLPISQVTLRSRPDLLNKQAHYEEVFERVKSRNESKRLRLPVSFLQQKKKYKRPESQISSVDMQSEKGTEEDKGSRGRVKSKNRMKFAQTKTLSQTITIKSGTDVTANFADDQLDRIDAYNANIGSQQIKEQRLLKLSKEFLSAKNLLFKQRQQRVIPATNQRSVDLRNLNLKKKLLEGMLQHNTQKSTSKLKTPEEKIQALQIGLPLKKQNQRYRLEEFFPQAPLNVLNIQDQLHTHESEKTMPAEAEPNFTISAGSLEKIAVPLKFNKKTEKHSKEHLIDVSEQDESQIEPMSNPYRESLTQTEKNILAGQTPEHLSLIKRTGSTHLALEHPQEPSRSAFSTSILKGPNTSTLPPELSNFNQQ